MTQYSYLWLNEVNKYHKDWIRMVRSFGAGDYSEDIVQEMYILLMKYVKPENIFNNGVLSKSYVYRTLFNAWQQLRNKSAKMPKVPLDELPLQIDETNEEKEAFDRICQMVEDEVDTWEDEDDRGYFDAYFTTGLSYRALGKECGRSWISIYYNIKESKKKIKEALAEDYEDYLNGDYDRI